MLIFATSAYPDTEPIQSFLRLACHGKRHRLTTDIDQAHAILFVENSRYHEDAFFSRLKHCPLVQKRRQLCFMYNEHDRPWYVLPGLYCSMPQRWFDSTRQSATRYIRLLNPVDSCPSDQPDILFSFLGNAQNPVRRQLLQLKSPRAIIEVAQTITPGMLTFCGAQSSCSAHAAAEPAPSAFSRRFVLAACQSSYRISGSLPTVPIGPIVPCVCASATSPKFPK